MRIAYMAGAFPTTRETFVAHEVIDLTRNGVQVDVFSWLTPKDEVIQPEVAESGAVQHVEYFRLRYLRRVIGCPVFWRTLAAAWRDPSSPFARSEDRLKGAYFAARLAQRRHRHAHTHFFGPGPWVARQAGCSASYTAHCFNVPLPAPESVREEANHNLECLALLVAESEFVREGYCTLVDEQNSHKVRVVRSGVDLDAFRPDPGETKDVDVACVAGWSPFKGIEYLIRATQIVSQHRPDLCVANIGGPAPWFPEYADQLQRERHDCGVESHLTYLGAQPSDRVRELLARSRVFALPSVVTADNLSDGLPVALVEAAAMSLPIVTTDVGGIPELIQHNVTGLVVPQRDAAALAAAIGQLLDDPGLCARLGGAARRRVEQEFSREVNGPRLVEALKPHLGAVDPA